MVRLSPMLANLCAEGWSLNQDRAHLAETAPILSESDPSRSPEILRRKCQSGTRTVPFIQLALAAIRVQPLPHAIVELPTQYRCRRHHPSISVILPPSSRSSSPSLTMVFARSTAFRAIARQGRQFSSTSTSRASAGAPEKASSAINDITKKAQELGGPALKRVEGLLGGRYTEHTEQR